MKKILQKKNIIIISVCIAVVVISFAGIIAKSNSRVKLVLDKISSDEVLNVDFGIHKPVSIDNTILVPLRTICDGSGFSLDWNEDAKSACVTLKANPESIPSERFCDLFLSFEKSTVAEVKNHSISIIIPVNSCDVKVYYNYTDTYGEPLSFENCHQWNAGARIIRDGTLMVPLRNIMESFGMKVEWNSKKNIITVSIPEADTLSFDEPSAEAASVQQASDMSLRTQTPFLVSEKTTDIPQSPSIMYSPIKNYTVGEYIGRFKVTHYCICSICNEGYGNSTAYGGAIRPGITIAVDPRVIKKLSWVYIDGYGARLAEDVGGAIKGNRIDMAVPDHATAMRMGVKYCDVWYAGVPDGSEKVNFSPAQGVTDETATQSPYTSPPPSETAVPSEEITDTASTQTPSDQTASPTPEPVKTPEATQPPVEPKPEASVNTTQAINEQ